MKGTGYVVGRAAALGWATALIFGSLAGASPSSAGTTGASVLGNCTYGALQAAVAKGGTVDFGCSGTIVFTGPISASRSVTLDGAGESVSFSGDKKVQLFKILGGTFTIVDLTLEDGSVHGTAGTKGDKGKAGENGAWGKDGPDGKNATYTPGVAGGDGGVGTVGSDGDAGGNGSDGHDGGDGQGGAVYVGDKATLVVAGDIFEHDSATGGAG
ncbi:MAG TPA: hypothetical protein VGP46_13860, partial [Acidimicrobiales bacterium]|nr:hypothetical protein [Acidimicrobiales bacterium]